ncbi:hypothetical protein [Peptostreptococcus faecalis]|uniref:hypothetical protein n=1 Tax=Peptostreptococcus faecalis TaxID=2045015 RepID=UPI000C7C8E73|nr:hypothetical protein [Peptostreptococcus faecalis]
MSLTKIQDKDGEIIKKAYKSAFMGVSNNISYLINICTKILFKENESRKVTIDSDRMYDEFVYLKYYSNSEYIYLLNFFLPLILSNRSFDSYSGVFVDLVEKICRFYKSEDKKCGYILDIFCYDILIRNLLVNKDSKLEDIMVDIKNEIVKYNPTINEKITYLEFQKLKIKYISEIHEIIKKYEKEESSEQAEDYSSVTIFRIIESIYENNITAIHDDGEKSVFNTILTLRGEDVKGSTYSDDFVQAMSEYLNKIRYGQISTNKYIGKSSPRIFLNMNIGDKIKDPILNNIEIISKEKQGDKFIIKISTKTGFYDFRYSVRN